jgi:hypothetical protein
MDTLATSILGTYQADFRSLMSANNTVQSCSLEFQVTADSVIPGLSVNPLAGTRAGAVLPASVCTCINWHTDFDHYRGGHARTYLSSGCQGDAGNTAWNTTFRSAVQSAAASFLTALNAAHAGSITAIQFGMLTRIRDKQPLAVPVFRPIISSSVRAVFATQRRRLT